MSNNDRVTSFESVANTELNMLVASNCSGFESLVTNTMISGEQCEVSCDNCKNFQHNKCVINLYDEILSNIEEHKC